MAGKFTELEQQVLDAKREGKNVGAVVSNVPGSAPVVSLRELIGAPKGQILNMPPAAPEPATEEQPVALPVVTAVQQKPREERQVSEADMERMKDAILGKAKPEEEEKPEEEPPDFESLAPVKDCPRCGWDVRKRSVEEATSDDKLAFVESLLGSTRFYKNYEMLGGRIAVRFRSLNVTEEDMISNFLREETDAKRIQLKEEWLTWFARCRLVLMLEQLTLDETTTKFPAVDLASYPVLGVIKDDSPMRHALRVVPAKWPMSFHAVLAQLLGRFDELHRLLVSRLYDENFWEGLRGK